MKRLRIGRRRVQARESSPLELALAPALEEGRWRIPDRFNFTRDVVEVLARDPKRRALTFVGADGIVEPRTFRELAEGANRWAAILRDRDVRRGDRVLALSGTTVDWVELALGCLKFGAVVVPSPPTLAASALETRFAASGASLVVATDESRAEIAQMSFSPDVHHLFEGRRRRASDVVNDQPTEDTASRDVAFLAWTAGTTGAPKPVAHTHGATYAARCAAEHWLGAGPGDVVWCTAAPGSLQALSTTVFGAWARGAEVALHDGEFDPVERLELIHRFDVTIVCQTPAEYRALAGRRELVRYRSRRVRRLVSTGDYLDPGVIADFEEAWDTTIQNGYGQAETNVVVAHGPEVGAPSASMGRALPGHHVAVVDEQGNELPQGIEGALAIRGRPPTLFAGYWDDPDATREAFRGDWYVTGDIAVADEDGNLWFVSRAEDTIASRGRIFGPHEAERVLRTHAAVRESAVVGIRDLERGGHFVRAFVIPEAAAEASEQLEAELRQFVAQSLVEQQVPREIEFIDALPTSPSGAVKRGELRERPVAGRPLWEMPPTSELELEPALPTVEAESLAPLYPDVARVAPASEQPVEIPSAGEPAAAYALPEAFVEPLPPEPERESPELLVEPQPDTTPALPVEPQPDTTPALPVEPQPDTTPALPVEPQPAPTPELLVEPQPEPVDPLGPPLDEPLDAWQDAADAARAAPPETPPKHLPELEHVPEPIDTAPPAPSVESKPVEPVEPVAATTSLEPAVEPAVEPELPVGAEPAVASATDAPLEHEPEPTPEPAPTLEAALPAAPPEPPGQPEPEPEPEATPKPIVEVVPPPEPEIEREPEPLPDFVVDPSRAAEPPPPPATEPQVLEDEEEDLGPLPEYILDPERPRLEPVASVEPEPGSTVAMESAESPAAPLFPSAPALDLSAKERAGEERMARPAASRPRPAPPPASPKRGGSTAEPGDETPETSWMRGLSSRLSAYSLEEGDRERRNPDEEPLEPKDDEEG